MGERLSDSRLEALRAVPRIAKNAEIAKLVEEVRSRRASDPEARLSDGANNLALTAPGQGPERAKSTPPPRGAQEGGTPDPEARLRAFAERHDALSRCRAQAEYDPLTYTPWTLRWDEPQKCVVGQTLSALMDAAEAAEREEGTL